MTSTKSSELRNGITKVAVVAALTAMPAIAMSIPAYATPDNGGALPATPPSTNAPAPPAPAPGRVPLNFGSGGQQPATDWGYGQGDGGAGGGGG